MAREQAEKRQPMSAFTAARRAARQLHELTGREPEGVVAVERNENGWHVGIEVVESRRIPDSADILAVYQADLDEAGRLQSYRRTERYLRSRTERS